MPNKNSAVEYINLLEKKAPELLDLFCSENNESFEVAFDKLLEKAIIGLQQNCKDYSALNENGLSSVLAQALQMPGLNVQREPSSNGHVDIMVTVDHSFPLKIKLIEAKIYDGPAYHIEGLNQLLGRYTTGQETRGIILEYVKRKDIAGLVKKIREAMDGQLPCQQKGTTQDHILKWSFLSCHKHSSGEDLDVAHIGCNMYHASIDSNSQS